MVESTDVQANEICFTYEFKFVNGKEFRFDVKKIAAELKEREQTHPDSMRTPRQFPVKKMAV